MIIGNWKMCKTGDEAAAFVEKLRPLVKTTEGVWIAAPFTALHALKGGPFKLGAQNMNEHDEGAFTGEVSAKMLLASGVTFCLLGHSERRHLFGETDQVVNAKVKQALSQGIQPVLCLGETLNEKEAGITEEVILRQLKEGLKGLSMAELEKLIIAYEPVWAIGSGLTASPEMAQAIHQFIRKTVGTRKIPLLYGGSVNASTIQQLINEPDIEGALVGGASLDPQTFSEIINLAL